VDGKKIILIAALCYVVGAAGGLGWGLLLRHGRADGGADVAIGAAARTAESVGESVGELEGTVGKLEGTVGEIKDGAGRIQAIIEKIKEQRF
jgi:hypothetical protein